jgi:diadenosine tetraphosphatase ApaH/serine/threonine PP2A family protein phosphatase
MRVLIVSDIHANQVALEAVLQDAPAHEAVWCLGDVIGYGPNPNECVEIVRDLPNLICLTGNHDAAAMGGVDLSSFNPEARQSLEWTQSVLDQDTVAFLKERPEVVEASKHVTLAHGSPRFPVYEYLLDTRSATENFDYFKTDYCFVGHTHLPVLFYLEPGDYMSRLAVPPINTVTELAPRAILNPGSVGQPRDRDPRSSYAIYDTESHFWDYRRVEYDIKETQRRMQEIGLPPRHAERLEGGW